MQLKSGQRLVNELCDKFPWLIDVVKENDLIRKVWEQNKHIKASTIIRCAYDFRKKIELDKQKEGEKKERSIKLARLKATQYCIKSKSVI